MCAMNNEQRGGETSVYQTSDTTNNNYQMLTDAMNNNSQIIIYTMNNQQATIGPLVHWIQICAMNDE